jgi:hypothetical protein
MMLSARLFLRLRHAPKTGRVECKSAAADHTMMNDRVVEKGTNGVLRNKKKRDRCAQSSAGLS